MIGALWFKDLGAGCYELKDRGGSPCLGCLDVSGASTAGSAAVITYTCNGGTNQQWTHGT